jgi:hypothetical protein
MKIILSRKGFDSGYGGYPSPILPNGKMVSLPIPSKDSLRYSDLRINELTYYDLMKDLKPKIKLDNSNWRDLDKETECHLDPDICKNIINREPGWKPCFGQIDAAQSHLENQKIGENDLFLFFGWFRKTKNSNGKFKFDPQERDLHAIFSYFQIGEIKRMDHRFEVPKWMAYHPHANENRRNNILNTIYIARPSLCWDKSLPGAGRFEFNKGLVLTKEGFSRSKWCLPDFFKEAEISYHNKDSWKKEYFQSAAKGQEFVIKDNKKIEMWAKELINGSKKEF